MSSSTPSGRPQPGHTWLRALVLLLALLLAGAPTAALAATARTAAAETLEHDVLDTPLRPPARTVHRADVPQHPAPLPEPAPAGPADHHRPCPTAPRPPYAAPLLRTVVLRC